MNKLNLIEQLQAIKNAKRIERETAALFVLKNKEHFKDLLKITFNTKSKNSVKAAWILELVCKEKINWLAPYLSYFSANINSITNESSLRPLAKICVFLANSYYSNQDSEIKKLVTKEHINSFIENGFQWLIQNHKVATKVYSMEFLYLFGKEIDWVYTELNYILQQNIMLESAAYKARGRKILKNINMG